MSDGAETGYRVLAGFSIVVSTVYLVAVLADAVVPGLHRHWQFWVGAVVAPLAALGMTMALAAAGDAIGRRRQARGRETGGGLERLFAFVRGLIVGAVVGAPVAALITVIIMGFVPEDTAVAGWEVSLGLLIMIALTTAFSCASANAVAPGGGGHRSPGGGDGGSWDGGGSCDDGGSGCGSGD